MTFKIKEGVIVDRRTFVDTDRNVDGRSLTLTANVNSTNTTTGTMVVTGGIGLSGNLNVGGFLNVLGQAIINSDINMSGDLTVSGDLYVTGNTVTINSDSISIDDKNIELGVIDIPTDVTADGGGITLKGTTPKTFNWLGATSSWTSSENIDLVSGKGYYINGQLVLNQTTLGPQIVNSSLTTLGTLISLTTDGIVTITNTTESTSPTTGALVVAGGVGIGGNVNIAGNLSVTSTGYIKLPAGTTAQRPGELGQPPAEIGQIRFNTTTAKFEGYYGPVDGWGLLAQDAEGVTGEEVEDIAFTAALLLG